MRVISRDGVARATTRGIVAEAGSSTAALHYSFTDKEELFEEVVAHCQRLTLTHFRERHPENDDLAHAVRTLFRMFVEWARGGAEFHVAQYELFFWGRRTSPARSFAADIYAGYIALCEQILADALQDDDPVLVSRLAKDVMAIADGLVLQVLAFGDKGPTDEDIERYSRLILSDVRPAVERRRGTDSAA